MHISQQSCNLSWVEKSPNKIPACLRRISENFFYNIKLLWLKVCGKMGRHRHGRQAGGILSWMGVQDKTKSFSDTELINKNGTCGNLEKPKVWKLHTQVNIAKIKDPDS